MPECKVTSEAIIVLKYSKRYEGSFYRTLGAALEYALPNEQQLIKDAFPEWWERCLRNTNLLISRGVVIE